MRAVYASYGRPVLITSPFCSLRPCRCPRGVTLRRISKPAAPTLPTREDRSDRTGTAVPDPPDPHHPPRRFIADGNGSGGRRSRPSRIAPPRVFSSTTAQPPLRTASLALPRVQDATPQPPTRTTHPPQFTFRQGNNWSLCTWDADAGIGIPTGTASPSILGTELATWKTGEAC